MDSPKDSSKVEQENDVIKPSENPNFTYCSCK